jgi:hypothetical protein
MLRQPLSFPHRPTPLVLGYRWSHTSKVTLAQGEAEINRVGRRLRAAGRL